MKLPKFMIAKNPMVETKGDFIVHTRKPKMMIRVVDKGWLTTIEHVKITEAYYDPFYFEHEQENHVIYITDFYSEYEPGDEKQNEEISQIIKRVFDWWGVYVRNANEKTKEC